MTGNSGSRVIKQDVQLCLLASRILIFPDYNQRGRKSYELNSCAASLMLFRLARFITRRLASLPVASWSSLRTTSPLDWSRAVIQTLAFLVNNTLKIGYLNVMHVESILETATLEVVLTLAVSLPIPAVAPVTRTTLPDMSGTSAAVNWALPGNMTSLMRVQ